MTDFSELSKDAQDLSRRIVIATIAVIVAAYFGWMAANSHFDAGDLPTTESHSNGLDAHAQATAGSESDKPAHGPPPAIYSVFPFVLLLLAIALLPLIRTTAHWWERNWNRLLVAAGLGILTLLYYVYGYGHGVVDHATHQISLAGWPAGVVVLKNAILGEYVPFIVLLFSLYVISGGIAVEGRLVGTPRLNATIIGIGAILASLIGTTGAAMLLIRPLLNANANRQFVAHTVVFFTFVVCNTGGCLLPIGDPPLFLGYLRGVDFFWTLNLWPMWLFTNLMLLAVYFAWDSVRFRHESGDSFRTPLPYREGLGDFGELSRVEGRDARAFHSSPNLSPQGERGFETPSSNAIKGDGNPTSKPSVRGLWNFMWLIGVIGCVVLLDPSKPLPGTNWHAPPYFREMMMLCLTALSLLSTSSEIRRRNAFNYDAILEVAALFSGIFVCMQAPIQILNTYGPSLGFDQPWKYYWGSGTLSSFLDNAPTYVVFFETAKATGGPGPTVAGVPVAYLAALSLGSVFMGAMTYIGNGPNFMVKAIAEKNNVRMPSFFGYMLYSCGVLLPISFVMTLLFL
ncbi:MAG: sodium:proton antiporter [Planctomycetaceae bacterium]